MKQNDWIVATLNNPNFSAADFKNIQNLTLDNTQLLSKEDYLKSSFITGNEMFANSDGTFNKDKFNSFYEEQAKKFQEFSQENTLDNYTYGFWDTQRKIDSKVDIPEIGIMNVPNPEHISLGVVGQGREGERTKSAFELAEQQKIFDVKNNKFLNYSPDDASLFKNPIRWVKEIFSEPLVLATYDQDEDSINPITGQMEHHVKGEKKLNPAGEYYFETLNGRSVIGKNVLSLGDIITSETSALNSVDFFDSDDLEKNPIGVVAKNLAAIAPMAFLGTEAALYYGGAYVLREMSKTMPMLYQMSTSLFGNTQDSKLANTLAAYGNKFTSGTSEYAKENTFSFENFGNLISEVALQWTQQKAIVEAISRVGNSTKKALQAARGKAMKEYEQQALDIINRAERGEELSILQYTGQLDREGIAQSLTNGSWENTIIGQAALRKFMPEVEKAYANRIKFGQDLSLAYMALISNTDVYESAIEHGASKKEAAAMALGSALGMFRVDKIGLGEMFFDDPDALAKRTFKRLLREESDKLTSGINTIARNALDPRKNYLGFINKGIKLAEKTFKKYQSDMKDRALTLTGKALGEGLEEVSEELVTDINKQLFEIAGSFGFVSQTDFGSWENARERYLMSFFGGAIGGGLYGGVEALRNPKSTFDKNNQKELLYLIKEGKTNDILEQLSILHDKGQLGSKELSIDTEDGIFLTTSDKHKSQNDFVYNIMRDSIIQMDNIINSNQLGISDEKLFERMVLSDPKYTALKDVLQGKSYITGYYEHYQDVVNKIYNNAQEISKLESETPDPQKRNTVEYQSQLQKLQQEREALLQETENFKNGNYSSEYVERMLFAMNPEISGRFLSMNFNQFVRANFFKSVENLSISEMDAAQKAWEDYNKTERKMDFETAFKLYKEVSKRLNPVLQELSEQSQQTKSWEETLNNIEKTFPANFLKSVEDIQDSEIEGFENLSKEELYSMKKAVVEQFNNQNITKFIQQFADNNAVIDQSSFRRLMSLINTRKRDLVYTHFLNGLMFPDVNETTRVKIKDSISRLKDDLSNLSDIKEEIKSTLRQYISSNGLNPAQGFDWERADNIPNKNYFTFQDILDVIEDTYGKNNPITEQDIDDLDLFHIESQELIQDLVEVHNLEINTSKENSDRIKEIQDKYDQKDSKLSYSNPNAGIFNAVLIHNGYYDQLMNDILPNELNSVENILNNIEANVRQDTTYKALIDLKRKLSFENNPTIKIIKAVAEKLGEDFSDIESTLQSIYEQYERLDNIQDYLLSSPQIEALEKALRLIDLAKGFINASNQESNYFHIMPFYKSVNEFNKSHGIQLEELPELDKDVANVALTSLNFYDREINQWITKSRNNSLNKIKEFKEFDQKFQKIKLDFLKQNLTKEGFGEDLIEGMDSIDFDSPNALFEVAKQLHYNFKKSGKTAKDLIPIFKRVISGFGGSEFRLQKSTNLNGNITADNFTAYDKFTYLTAIFSEDPVDFYIYYKDFVENKSTNNDGNPIAPLAFQEHVIKIAHAQEVNPSFINEVMEEIKKEFNFPIGYLSNTTIITGLGGAGKTQVVARALVSSDSVWFSGPSNTQIENLLKINPNGKGLSKEELFSSILESGEYEKIKQESTSEAKNGQKLSIRIYPGKGRYITLNSKNIKFKKLDSYPKQLIIDEATLFNSAELHVLALWAKQNNVNLKLIGDENQNGNSESGRNLEPEYNFAFRTPRMSISLRQANYWKFINQKPLEQMMDSLRNIDSDVKAESVSIQLQNEDLKNYQLHYYFQNGVLTGDILTPEISDEVINTLNGTIGFVGEPTSSTYLKLKNSGKTITLLSENEVQGQEFDFIVIDRDWKLNPNDTIQIQMFTFMQNLYTMITRSRKGSVIIDNGLSKIIAGSKEEFYTTDAITLNSQSISEFTQSKLNYLNSLDLTPRTIETPKVEVPTPPEESEPIKIEAAPIEIGKQSNQELENEEEKEPLTTNTPPISEFPFTVYGNIGYTGLNLERDGDNREVWTSNGSLRDIDIFLSDEIQDRLPRPQRRKKLISKDDQIKYSSYLLRLKSYISFGGDWQSLPPIITNFFTKEDIDNMEYYLVSENEDFNKHHTLRIQQGLTDSQASFIKDGDTNQVLSLQGRINKNGKVYTITLGALESLDGSKNSREILKDQIRRENPNLNEGAINVEIDKIINLYEREINNLVSQKERRISKPLFTRKTGLRKVNRKDYRLKDINQEENKQSKYELSTVGYVTSPVYTIVSEEEIQKLGLSDKLVGKPIMYVSANMNLNPKDLPSLYAQQKQNPNAPLEVRCVVLDSEGVSFESLLRPNYARKHYNIKVGENKTFHAPFLALPMAIRMYVALWNFRANIVNFNNAVKDEFGDETDLADELAKLDSDLYTQARNANSGKYLNFGEFKTWVRNTQTQEVQDKVKRLWDFNDKLTQNGIGYFRLGYSNQAGSYVRKVADNLNCVYINRDLAENYESSIKNLFANVIDVIIPSISNDIGLFIDKKTTWKNWEDLERNWTKKLNEGGSLEITTSEGVINHNFGPAERIRMLPAILKQINTNLLEYQMNPMEYDQEMQEGHHQIKIGDTNLDYMSLVTGIFSGIEASEEWNIGEYPIGTEPFDWEAKTGIIDKRLIYMFNLAFHGIPKTREFNDLTTPGLLKATGALFPNGFYVDTFISDDHTDNVNKEVLNDVTFYSTDVVPSGPIIRFSFNEYSQEQQEVPQEEENINIMIKDINNAIGSNIQENSTLEDIQQRLEKFRIDQIESLFDGTEKDNILSTPIGYENGRVITLQNELNQKYPNIENFKRIQNIYRFISNGNTIYLKKGSQKGTYILEEAQPTVSTEQETQNISTINEIANYIIEQVGLDEEYSKYFIDNFAKKQNLSTTRQSLLNRVNNLDQLDPDDIQKIESIIRELPEVNDGICTLPTK